MVMKTMRHILNPAVCLCALALVSCKVEFDFSDLDGAPLFLIDGYVRTGTGESNMLMYLYAVPSAAGEREFSEEARCTLKVFRNSELIDTHDQITVKDFYGLIAGTYNEEFKPGDRIDITAGSEGFPTASATTVIPDLPPALEMSCSLEGDDLKVRFSFEDNPETEDAYAFCFRKGIYRNPPAENDQGSSCDLAFGNSSGSSFIETGPFDVSWEDGYRYYGISDDTFSGSRKEFEVTVPSFWEYPYKDRAFFRIEVQRISPERLRYERACIDKATNGLGFIGLAPVTFAYTNVSGGSGCFSSQNIGFTPWIEIRRQNRL